jgi:hypothetical protein
MWSRTFRQSISLSGISAGLCRLESPFGFFGRSGRPHCGERGSGEQTACCYGVGGVVAPCWSLVFRSCFACIPLVLLCRLRGPNDVSTVRTNIVGAATTEDYLRRSAPVLGRSNVRRQEGPGICPHAGGTGACCARGRAHSGGAATMHLHRGPVFYRQRWSGRQPIRIEFPGEGLFVATGCAAAGHVGTQVGDTQ